MHSAAIESRGVFQKLHGHDLPLSLARVTYPDEPYAEESDDEGEPARKRTCRSGWTAEEQEAILRWIRNERSACTRLNWVAAAHLLVKEYPHLFGNFKNRTDLHGNNTFHTLLNECAKRMAKKQNVRVIDM